MGKQIIRLSDPALDHIDFFKAAGQGLATNGAAFISGDIPHDRIFAMANLCQAYSRPHYVAPMINKPQDQMVPPREILHERGYYCHYAQISPPLNVPDEIGTLYLEDEDPEALQTALQELYPRIITGGVIIIGGAGANQDLATNYAGPEGELRHGRSDNTWTWHKWAAPQPVETSATTQNTGPSAETSASPVPVSTVIETEATEVTQANSENEFVILCYPNYPGGKFRKMCDKMGYKVTNNPTIPFDFAIKWIGETFTPNDIVIEELQQQTRLVNLKCQDISKSFVEEVHKEVFGYSLEVDPRTFQGQAVEKANLNAQCKESVLDCPTEAVQHGFIYQRLVITPTEPDEYEEYRVAITGNEITYVVIKRRPVSERFNRSAGYAIIKEADEVFSPEEKAMIFRINQRFGFEYGDLDILRDQRDQRIYVIDLNPTPGGPGGGYEEAQRQDIVERLTQAFQRQFFAQLRA